MCFIFYSIYNNAKFSWTLFVCQTNKCLQRLYKNATNGVCMCVSELGMSSCIVFNFRRGERASHTFSGLLIPPQRLRQFIGVPFSNYIAIHVTLPVQPPGLTWKLQAVLFLMNMLVWLTVYTKMKPNPIGIAQTVGTEQRFLPVIRVHMGQYCWLQHERLLWILLDDFSYFF